MSAIASLHNQEFRWPEEGISRVPYWVYTDPEIFEREMEVIFCGKSWNFVALSCELTEPGSFKTTYIGNKPVVVTRGEDGEVHCFVNRCAHRGVRFCTQSRGKAKDFTCPYHQWNYDLEGNLQGVPFRRGVKKQGGMPKDFDRANHGLQKLKVVERNGGVFASFRQDVEGFEEYLGPTMLEYYDRVFNGREMKVLGYQRQRIKANWKLMFENIKDPYHASLMHIFLVTFGLFRADQESAVKMDETGRHCCLISMKGEQKHSEHTKDMNNLRETMQLNDQNMLTPVREYPGKATVVMQTIWPNIIIQQQTNSLAMRQLVPRAPGEFELHWIFFGYADEGEEMTQIRLRQANLMGVSGYVSVDDSEVLEMSQDSIGAYPEGNAVIEMGGREASDEDHMVTESGLRGFYQYYRQVMGL